MNPNLWPRFLVSNLDSYFISVLSIVATGIGNQGTYQVLHLRQKHQAVFVCREAVEKSEMQCHGSIKNHAPVNQQTRPCDFWK